ncbi:MAG: TPM domain-containing protein, partial [Terracidiphilus sp.]
MLAAFLAFFPLALHAERIEDLPQPTDYVSDNAHVLSPEAIAHIDSICAQLDHSKANAQIAVVTIHTLEGDDPSDYATRLFEKMKVGSKVTDRGVLILLAVDDHKRWIETGYGVEGVLNDAKVGDIGRAMVPDLRANDFDGAVTLAVGQVAQDIAADAQVTLNDDEPIEEQGRPVHQQGGALAKLILLVIVMVFFGGFSLLRMLFGFG